MSLSTLERDSMIKKNLNLNIFYNFFYISSIKLFFPENENETCKIITTICYKNNFLKLLFIINTIVLMNHEFRQI